jgi:hypothetical protein
MDMAEQLGNQVRGVRRRDPSPAEALKLSSILSALCVENVADLDSPLICDASYHPDRKPESSMLLVTWIEDRPTADAVRLVWSDGRAKDCRIDQIDIAQNLEISQYAVVYNATFYFDRGSADELATEPSSLPSAVLLKSGKEISNRSPLVWIGSTPVAETPDGESATSTSD